MLVKRLSSIEDQRVVGPNSSELVITDPSWSQIESAIRQLDGKNRTMVILSQEIAEFEYMVVGGGKNGVYSCGVYDQQGREFILIDPSKSSATFIKVPTGQPTTLSLRETIELEDAIIAAKEYSETGERAEELVWEERKSLQ